MSKDVLGPEWGALAGLPAEEGLKIVSEYAGKIESLRAGGNVEPPAEGDEPSTAPAALLHELAVRQRQPVASEFVGNRESAIQRAKLHITQQNQDWDRLHPYVVQAMAKATPQLQTDPNAWVEAWWYVWGLEKRAEQNKPAEEAPDEDSVSEDPWDALSGDEEEAAEPIPPRPRQTVSRSPVNTQPQRTAPANKGSKITDPGTRRVKGQFENLLGRNISDREWQELDANVNTSEDYARLQKSLERR